MLMFGLYYGNKVREQREAEFAYQETRRAFGLIAQNLDRGTEKVAFILEIEPTKQKISNKNLKAKHVMKRYSAQWLLLLVTPITRMCKA